MKFSTVLAGALSAFALLSSSVSASGVEDRAREAFDLWTEKHGVSYSSPLERERRFAVFAENFRDVLDHNSRGFSGDSFQKGLNKFSDMTVEEFQSTLTYKATEFTPEAVHSKPSNTDRRSYHEVECDLGVRDQGNCGSCWAFSTIAVVESINCRLNGEKMDLSEQHLVDCDKKQMGCHGANHLDSPLNFVAKSGGVASIKDYPYTARDGKCQAAVNNLHANVIGKARFIKTVDHLMDELDKHGAASVALDASSFKDYSSGVLTPANCKFRGLNHAVTATGYSVEEDGRVLVRIKNSWGTGWGEAGYVTVQYGACGLGGEMIAVQSRATERNYLRVE